MAAQIANQFEVAEAELAYLVLNYLEERGWTKTAGSMKREAKDLLRAGSQRFAVGTIPKPLATIVSEYLKLTYKETQRALLQKSNPLAHSMYSLLDYTAGGAVMTSVAAGNNNSNNNNMQQQQQQQAMMYPQQQQQQMQHVGGGGGGGGGLIGGVPISMVPMNNGLGNNNNNQQHHQGRQPPLTPGGRHAQRKGAPPKRRRLDTDFDNTAGNNISHHNITLGGLGGGLLPYFPPYFDPNSLPSMPMHNIDPLNNGEDSIFGDGSFNFFGAVDEKAMLQFSGMLADNINKTQETHEDLLTDTLLDDKEFGGFLNKLVSAHPIVDPNFRIGAHSAGGTGGSVGDGNGAAQQAQERPSPSPLRSSRQSGQQQQQQPTPMSPLGGSRLGKRKSTPTKQVRVTRSGAAAAGKEQLRSPSAQSAEKSSEKERQTVADEIAEYLMKPDDFEDLINECVG